jgi:GT2 family glycosyltransferase
MQTYPKVAIIYLLFYHNHSYIDDVVSALKKITYPKDKIEFVIVSNPHPVEGSFLYYIDEAVMPLSGTEIPHVTVLAQETNLGFASGNNAGVKWALERGFDYIYFHNNDGFPASNAFEPLIEAMEQDKNIAIAQSLLLLHPETDLINSSGNSFHYLGFGFCDKYREKASELCVRPIQEVSYASGAAFAVRASLVSKFGMWDPDFFLYHEDLEWCFRLRAAGYKIVMVKDSIFYHKYQFGRSVEKFYWMERNRYGVLLMFFKWKTLLLLLPMLIAMEIGLCFFALKGGWLGKRFEIWKYWMNKDNLKLWLGKRKMIQKIRVKSDRFLMSYAVSEIKFQEKSMENPLLLYVGNPVMKLYFYLVVRSLIWW